MDENDSIFENLKTPCWATSLSEANADNEELDDSFFPEPPEVEEVTEELAHVNLQEDTENLSRLAMFGNRPQIKRRSQIRREQAAANNQRTVGIGSVNPPKRDVSLNRALSRNNNTQREMRNPSIERNSRSVVRTQPQAIPNNRAPMRIHTARAPVMVKSTSRPAIAFGTIVRQNPQEVRSRSVVLTRQELPKPPTGTLPILRGRAPLAISPTRSITGPQRPVLVPSRSETDSQHSQASSRDPNRRSVMRNIKEIVDRLSAPKRQNLPPKPVATPTRTVPNTYTHGIRSFKTRRSALPAQFEFGSPARRNNPNNN